MSVESELGKGSRFSFTAFFGQALNVNVSPVKTAISLDGFRILIADHSRINRLVLREMLADTGAEIDEAANGNNALNAIRQAAEEGHPYQFILLDMAIASVDGFEVARRLRNYNLPLKSVLPMLSSDELKPQITRLQQLGLVTYLVKPIARTDLLEVIRTRIDDAQRERATASHMTSATDRAAAPAAERKREKANVPPRRSAALITARWAPWHRPAAPSPGSLAASTRLPGTPHTARPEPPREPPPVRGWRPSGRGPA